MFATTRHRSEIDGLRAIAVVAVILNHFNHDLLPGGYLGVDIFFVISGYVISLSLGAQDAVSLKDLLLGFYARRFKRLMPALILCVAVTSILLSLVDSAPAQSLMTGAAALFGLSNIYLLKVSNDYFGGPSQLNAFTHTWSLGVEEQFYLIFPFGAWLFLQKATHQRVVAICAGILATSALSAAAFGLVRAYQPMTAFYLMPLRLWELAAGCLVAVWQHQHGRPVHTGRTAWETCCLAVIVIALFLPLQLALPANLAVVAATAASLAILSQRSVAGKLLTSKPAIYLGLMSYSLYLWHWPILVLGRYTIGIHAWSAPILIGLILLVAQMSYRLVEQPLRVRRWAATPGRTIAGGMAAAVLAAGVVVILAKPLEGRLYSGQPAQLAARNVDSLADPYRIPQTPYRWAGAGCVLSNDADVGKYIVPAACTLGRADGAQRRVMVFGNSFSAAFVQGFDALVRDDHYAVTITSAWGASPIGAIPHDTPRAQSNSYYWNTVVPRLIAQLHPGDWVILISDIAELAPLRPTPLDLRKLQLYKQGLTELSAHLATTGVRLAVLDATPFIKDAYCRPETALPQWFAPNGGPCTFFTKADTIARRQAVDTALHQLQQEHRLAVIDLLDVFCPGNVCDFVGRGNHVLYRDEFSHPSVEAVRDAAPLLRHLLTSA